jgi:hypothetical protein
MKEKGLLSGAGKHAFRSGGYDGGVPLLDREIGLKGILTIVSLGLRIGE